MRPVTHDYQSLNEYTLPLQGKPYYRSSGIIYAVDRNGNKYAVGRVDLERFDDQNFQYVFTPEWSVIDTLPSSIFQGIPGLDMSMRPERYYRVNMPPYFISERTPSESREDLTFVCAGDAAVFAARRESALPKNGARRAARARKRREKRAVSRRASNRKSLAPAHSGGRLRA